jgi:hypothetical protein
MAIVDANVVLRYLLDDHLELSVKTAKNLTAVTRKRGNKKKFL